MDDSQDLVVFVDEAGDEKTMVVLDYFFYEGQEYAVLTEADECDCEECEEECEEEHADDCDCGCGHDHAEADAFIMKVVPVGEDQEEFVPVDDELMDKLIDFVQNELYAGEDEGEDEDYEDEDEDDE